MCSGLGPKCGQVIVKVTEGDRDLNRFVSYNSRFSITSPMSQGGPFDSYLLPFANGSRAIGEAPTPGRILGLKD